MPTGEDLTTGQLIECMRVLKVIQNNLPYAFGWDTVRNMEVRRAFYTVIDMVEDELEIVAQEG